MQHLRDQGGNQITYIDRYLTASCCIMAFRGVAGITQRPALPRSPLHLFATNLDDSARIVDKVCNQYQHYGTAHNYQCMLFVITAWFRYSAGNSTCVHWI